MATIEQMREKLRKLNERGSGSSKKWFPKDKHVVRLLPLAGQEEPYKVIWFHYNLGKFPLYCPKQNSGSDCSVCDLSAALKEWDDDKSEADRKADFKQGCKLEAGPKYYFSMVERVTDAESKKVTNSQPAWWSLNENAFKELGNIITKDDSLEIHTESMAALKLDPVDDVWQVLVNSKTAFDIEVDLRKANNEDGKGNAKKFNQTVITEKKRCSPLSKDQAEEKKILESIPDFSGVEKSLTSDEINKHLETFLSAGSKDAKSDSDGTEKSADVNNEKPADGKRSVEDALADIMKD
jgi:hypothetical protein